MYISNKTKAVLAYTWTGDDYQITDRDTNKDTTGDSGWWSANAA